MFSLQHIHKSISIISRSSLFLSPFLFIYLLFFLPPKPDLQFSEATLNQAPQRPTTACSNFSPALCTDVSRTFHYTYKPLQLMAYSDEESCFCSVQQRGTFPPAQFDSCNNEMWGQVAQQNSLMLITYCITPKFGWSLIMLIYLAQN